MSEYEIHEALLEHIEAHSGSVAPDTVTIPNGHSEIPPGTYRKNRDGLWVAAAREGERDAD